MTSSNNSALSTRSNPVCLEVLVTLRSLPTEAGNPAHPIREELKTVIVFDNGAVLRSANNLPAGLTLILSNSARRDVVCSVVSGRSMPSVKGYVEIEFIEPAKDFWGIHEETMQGVPSVPAVTPSAPASAPTSAVAAPPVDQASSMPSAPTPRTAPPVPGTTEQPAWPTLSTAIEPPSIPLGPTLTGTAEFDEFPGPMSDVSSDLWPSVATREPKPRPPAQPSASVPSPVSTKPASEKPAPSYEHIPVAGSTSVADWNVTTNEPALANSALPSVGDSPSRSAPSAAGHDFMSKGLMAYEQSAETTRAAGGRMPLILGAAAIVFAAIVSVVLFTHHGSSAAPIASATPPVTQPVQTQPAPAMSALVQSARQSEASAPPQVESQPEAQPIAAAHAEPSAAVRPIPATEISDSTASTSRTDSRSARQQDKTAAATKQSDSASSKRPTLSSLKIGAPKAPKKNLGDAGEAAPVTEIASAEMPASATSANLLTSSGRTASTPLPPASAPAPPPPVQSVTDPKLVSSTRPLYPQTARQANIEGTVTLVIYIDQTGKVFSARSLSGPVMLRAAAEDAVKQWRYSPGLEDGKPAQSHTVVKVDFKLN